MQGEGEHHSKIELIQQIRKNKGTTIAMILISLIIISVPINHAIAGWKFGWVWRVGSILISIVALLSIAYIWVLFDYTTNYVWRKR